jgi:polyhydroxybutyrate depolymerase
MKKFYITLLLFAFSLSLFAQMSTQSWDFDGEDRQYLQYVPSVYDESESVPLVIALHGLGDNMNDFSGVGFQFVADTANFIVVYPEALEFIAPIIGSMGNAWNSGAGTFGIYPNETIDDVGFINAIMDSVGAHYNIDQSKIFLTGFSMGGFMSNRLACQLTGRVAAVASVAGTVGDGYTCTPSETIPMCHFHGTSDSNVGYGTDGGGVGENTFGLSVVQWMDFWGDNDGCSNITLEGQFPNIAGDGMSVEYVEYSGCTDDTRVVHYKVNNADHVWLGPNNDVFYTVEIWKFFLGLSPDNLVPAAISDEQVSTVGVYPNPATNVLRIENLESRVLNVSVFNTTGQLVKEFSNLNGSIDISDLDTGVYHIMIATEKGLFSNSFVKN